VSTLSRFAPTRLLNAEGSSRGAALMRIGVALLIWARFADDLALYHDRDWVWGLLGGSIYLSSFCLLIGFKSRFAALWSGLTIAVAVIYLGVIQKHYSLVHHHVSLLMIFTFLLALTPCGRSFSVDRWRSLKTANPLPEWGPLWGVHLIALQASAVWFWGAVDKLHAGWLSGDRLQAIWMYYYTGSDFPTTPGFVLLSQVAAVSAVIVELGLALGMWRPRWHKVLIPLAIAFHAVTYFTVPVATFTATMFLLMLAYIPAQTVHAAVDRLVGKTPSNGG
jgi:hypothetical protein